MHLDLPTFMIAGSFVSTIAGAVLLQVWWRDRKETCAYLWGVADILLAIAVAILARDDSPSAMVGHLVAAILLVLAAALVWSATRAFRGVSTPPAVIFAGVAIMLIAPLVPDIRARPNLMQGLNLSLDALYFLAAAAEFWRGRTEALSARWPLTALLLLHVGVNAAGAMEAFAGELAGNGIPPLDRWFGLIHFETLLFVVGTAVFLVTMVRERAELRQRMAASIDALTGVPNRRAFMEYAARTLEAARVGDAPLSLVLFDLDRFKSINDSFGHAAGDRVLVRFAEVARSALRANDMVGRIGGEEFAPILPGSSPGAAYVIADRIRAAFADAGRMVGDVTVNATASAGVATAHPDTTLDSLLRASGERLYRAKTQGRNRVERTARHDEPATVIRAA